MALSTERLSARIREAMRAAGLTQVELANAAEMDPTALNKALMGRRGLKSLEVALIAEALGQSTDALLADDDMAVSPPAFAARLQVVASPAVEKAMAWAEQLREVDRLLNELGYPETSPLRLEVPPATGDPVRQGERLAATMRQQAAVGAADLPQGADQLAAWAERAFGIDVCMTALPVGLDGLALSDGRLRLALVSTGVAATRQRFTIAHEICHLACGDGATFTLDENVFGERTPEERRANAFAAAFLMPAEAIEQAITGRAITAAVVSDLLGRFRVSLDAFAFRLHNLNIVDAAGRDRVRSMYSQVTLRPGRVDDLQARNDRRAPGGLLKRVMAAYHAGEIGIRVVAQVLDTDVELLLGELSPPRFPGAPAADTQHHGYEL
ncbi:ImmA/IrrE family metallo-endopeptidase [Natronosporangium hydrolyticum]|uniref:ImmA/IrrE family metallo-endopeptidase n=1 Tax=Natronosporangium hydrolyticum TaxID=2811111 RepID=A0A895YGD1_9ACTN|nr:XRE family transcriptional regulator [Natronosporangium hydrolyticum]QSB15152.1 ImmA/IrrE family metallo-endopeptidase [Natronosporangium hydrolyticum]